jgi:hypothetical protein
MNARSRQSPRHGTICQSASGAISFREQSAFAADGGIYPPLPGVIHSAGMPALQAISEPDRNFAPPATPVQRQKYDIRQIKFGVRPANNRMLQPSEGRPAGIPKVPAGTGTIRSAGFGPAVHDAEEYFV